jgi:hypothetical protein
MLRWLVDSWRRVHRWPWWLRRPAKLGVFLLLVALVLYPKFWLLPEWWRRLGHINGLIEPSHPGLASLEQVARAKLGQERAPEAVLRAVELTVYERIPYAWDWDVWGVMDYVPTVAEVLEQGREDCDGRAVLAASLLRRMGCDAWLVSDMVHVWVATPAGETMGPGRGEKTLVGTESGTRARLSLAGVMNVGRGTAFGVGVFPIGRELIILAALCGLSLQPGTPTRRRIAGCLVLVAAFGLLRVSGEAVGRGEALAMQFWLGLAAAVVGWLMLVVTGGGKRSRSRAARPE